MPNYAVIDCGTNTFHVLIAQANPDGSFEALYAERRFVKLAEEGIERIGDAPYQRALQTLLDYKALLEDYSASQVRVTGTAALRTASNGPALVAEVKQATGFDIDVISGREEARLIFEGVKLAVAPQTESWMIMDIGGGSVEFILVDAAGSLLWAESFPVGVAVLKKHFHQSEPIAAEEIDQLLHFLRAQLVPLHLALARFSMRHLVGAAGTFDVVAALLAHGERPTAHSFSIDLPGFAPLYQRLLHSTLEERQAMPEIPKERVDYIVVAMALIAYILDAANITSLTVSNYAIKEGLMAQMAHGIK